MVYRDGAATDHGRQRLQLLCVGRDRFLIPSVEEGASARTRFAGLDVSARETSVCVVDEAGKVLAERKIATAPDNLIELLRSISSEYSRIGLEAGPLSQWLVNGLAEAGLPLSCASRPGPWRPA